MSKFINFSDIASKMEQVYAGAESLEANESAAYSKNHICSLVSFSGDGNNKMDVSVRVCVFSGKPTIVRLFEKEFRLSTTSDVEIAATFKEALEVQKKYTTESVDDIAVVNIDKEIARLQAQKELYKK